MNEVTTYKDLFNALKTDIRFQLAMAATILFAMEMTSFFAGKMLMTGSIPLFGSFIIYFFHGLFFPVIISFLISFLFAAGCWLWYMGAEKRTIANYILTGVISFIFLTWMALYFYTYWEGIEITPYPWLAYSFFKTSYVGSLERNHLLICLAGSYSLLIIAYLMQIFSMQTKAEKVFGKAHFAKSFEIKKAGLFSKTGLVLGKAYGRILRLGGFESILIAAPTGSGKTTAIAIPNLIEWQGSAVINDLKGELYKKTSRYRKEAMGNKCYNWQPADESMSVKIYERKLKILKCRGEDLQQTIFENKTENNFCLVLIRDYKQHLSDYGKHWYFVGEDARLNEINGYVHDTEKLKPIMKYLESVSYSELTEDNKKQEDLRLKIISLFTNTHRYNPFYYVNKNPDLRIKDLQLIAEVLMPEQKHANDKFWVRSSREILMMLALYLFETEGMPTMSRISALSRTPKFFTWIETQLKTKPVESEVFYQLAASILIADKEKVRPNILKDFHTHMSLFLDPVVALSVSGNDFDFREIRKEKMSVYINIPDADKERLSPVLTLFWAQFINAMARREPDLKVEPYPVLALMDEFGNMARISKLQVGMTFLRSYRVRCVAIVQYLGQIISTYGRDDAKAFLNSKVQIAYALTDSDDRDYFSKALGTKTVRVGSSSTNTGHGDQGGSRSDNISFQSRALMKPDEIGQMPDKQEIILIEARSPVKAQKAYWFKEKGYKELLEKYISKGAN